jgi:cytochrome c553
MRISWKHVAVTLVALPFVGIFVAWLGVFNIGASTGHWKITDWFLHFAMRSAVRTYSLAVEVPEELPREGIEASAGHFHTGCAVCHGAPGFERSPSVLAMLPPPPDLVEILSTDKWTDAELYRIVMHGVRFTGMPAWPTQDRDDEIWNMVAFLRELPALDEAGYRQLAFGPSAETDLAETSTGLDAVIADCARCHGEDGLGRGDAVPILAGQREAYLEASLEAYRAGTRESGVMELAAVQAGEDVFADLAAHYAALPFEPAAASPADPAMIELGRSIAESGIPNREIPACASCHERPDRNPVYPSIDGQKEHYLRIQLELFAEEKRGGTNYRPLMQEFSHNLEPEEIEAAAAYYASRGEPQP